MAELADAVALGATGETLGGSNPLPPSLRVLRDWVKKEKMEKHGLTTRQIDEMLEKLKPHPVVAMVDDDPKTLDLLERVLHDEGFKIHAYQTAEQLLAEYGEIQPDTILMEAVLPGMNGLSCLEELRPKNPDGMTPVLILSKKDDPRSKLLAFRRGAFDYVLKPFNAEEVGARTRALVRAKLLQDFLRDSSISDPVTAVYNIRFLVSWLEREIPRIKRYKQPLSCLAVNVDKIKKPTSAKEEQFEDFVLKKFSKLVSGHLRQSDVVGRLEEDDFLIFLPGTSKEDAVIVARRIRELVSGESFQFKGLKLEPTLSMGILGCNSTDEIPPAKKFLERAQEALGQARAVGVGETAVSGLE